MHVRRDWLWMCYCVHWPVIVIFLLWRKDFPLTLANLFFSLVDTLCGRFLHNGPLVSRTRVQAWAYSFGDVDLEILQKGSGMYIYMQQFSSHSYIAACHERQHSQAVVLIGQKAVLDSRARALGLLSCVGWAVLSCTCFGYDRMYLGLTILSIKLHVWRYWHTSLHIVKVSVPSS